MSNRKVSQSQDLKKIIKHDFKYHTLFIVVSLRFLNTYASPTCRKLWQNINWSPWRKQKHFQPALAPFSALLHTTHVINGSTNKNSQCKSQQRALSICQNWPAEPLPDQSVSKWNQLFQKGFCWKTIYFVHTISDLTDLTG